MAGSVLLGGAHALQALDEINSQFHSVHTWNNLTDWCWDRSADRREAWDRILYRFDYLLLLLNGALDAQARVAHLLHSLQKPGARQASFRPPFKKRHRFGDELSRSGAAELVKVIDDQEIQHLLTLIWEPRITSHEAA